MTATPDAAHLGRGWAFPLQTSPQGTLQMTTPQRSVEESIWTILRTELGERVYRSNFGSRLSELAFAPLNIQTLLQIRLYVEAALKTWEPRITLTEIRTDPDPIRGRVEITIFYELKETHTPGSFVYPFYLVQEGG